VALDFQGNIVSAVEIIALILLVIGVYPYRIRTKNRNLIMHGFLSIAAIALNLAVVLYAMVPSFNENLGTIIGLPLLQSSVVWLHAALGAAALVLGLVIIFSWVTHPLGELGCAKTWRLMIPTFSVWALVLAFGLIIHVYSIV
jgi:hypothetical protein